MGKNDRSLELVEMTESDVYGCTGQGGLET